jgi:hypothetical protein
MLASKPDTPRGGAGALNHAPSIVSQVRGEEARRPHGRAAARRLRCGEAARQVAATLIPACL